MRFYCTSTGLIGGLNCEVLLYIPSMSLQVVKSGQKRQPCEENAPCIKSPTPSSENPLTSDLKSENGSKRNIRDVDAIPEELKVNVRNHQ